MQKCERHKFGVVWVFLVELVFLSNFGCTCCMAGKNAIQAAEVQYQRSRVIPMPPKFYQRRREIPMPEVHYQRHPSAPPTPPPEAQVAPLTGPTAAPELSLHPTPKAAARIVLPTRKIKAKARPKPRAIVVADPASVVQCIEANLGSTLELAIGGSQVAHLLSLDYHHVLDRDYNSSVTLFRRLQSLPQVAVIILSKCSTQSLITQAGVFIQRVLAEANYSVRDVPAYYIRGSNKAQRLYQELQRTSLSFSSVLHVDDKSFITKDFDHWSRYSWCGVQLHTHRAVELYDRLEPYIADW